MRLGRSLWIVVSVLVTVVVAACGSGPAAPPTQPTAPPITTPSPTPSPTGIVLPAGMTCSPTPPPLLRMHVAVFSTTDGRVILDSKPLVVNVDHYCDRVGFGDWKFCFTRAEGDPQRVACDYLVTGKASDTGRWGPTWTYNGKPCDGTAGCVNNPDEQFKAIARWPGSYEACVSPLVKIYDGASPYPGTRCSGLQVNMP